MEFRYFEDCNNEQIETDLKCIFPHSFSSLCLSVSLISVPFAANHQWGIGLMQSCQEILFYIRETGLVEIFFTLLKKNWLV